MRPDPRGAPVHFGQHELAVPTAHLPSYVGCKSGEPYEPDPWTSSNGEGHVGSNKRPDERATRVSTTTGWTDCGHGDNYRPGIVLDPFAGSGTTLAVATGRGHHGIGIDIDSRNVALARDRVGPFFLDEFTLDEWKARSADAESRNSDTPRSPLLAQGPEGRG